MVGGEGLPPPHAKQYTTDGDEMQLRSGLKFYFSSACGELQRKRGRSGRSLALPALLHVQDQLAAAMDRTGDDEVLVPDGIVLGLDPFVGRGAVLIADFVKIT